MNVTLENDGAIGSAPHLERYTTYPTKARWCPLKPPETPHPINLVLEFRTRARRLRVWAGTYLLAIVATLVAGGFTFIWLPRFLAGEEGFVDRIVQESTRLGALREKKIRLEKEWEEQKSRDIETITTASQTIAPPRGYRNYRLFDLHFTDDTSRGWAVGGRGTILSTTNGGKKWSEQESGTNNNLRAVHFAEDEEKGWTVGDRGAILSTIDGGEMWSKQESDTSDDLYAIHFSEDKKTGWAVGEGGMILSTSNGGENWTEQRSDTSDDLYAIHFSEDKKTGWAVGEDGIILSTSNGGTNWTRQEGDTSRNLWAVHFAEGDEKGWAVGNRGTILATTNGGKKWSEQESGTSDDLHAIHFSEDKKTGWAVGEDGVILTTTNGGETWNRQDSSTSESLYAVHFSGSRKGWAVGSGRAILRSDDGGAKWSKPAGGTSKDLLAVQFAEDAMTGWAVGQDGTILKTTNGGSTWRETKTKTMRYLWGLHFLDDAMTGWVVGQDGMILKTTNGGEEWNEQRSDTEENLYAIHFIDKTKGWAVGDDGVVLKTTNGGNNWQVVESGTQVPLWAVHFADNSGTGWTVGHSGIILKTINGGDKWSRQDSRISQGLRDVYFSNNDKGWAVGDEGVIIATSNGGKDWTKQSSGTEKDLKAILFKDDAKTGWVVGGEPSGLFLFFNYATSSAAGVVLTTVNSGDTWHKRLGDAAATFHSLDFSVDTRTGWIVGNDGTVLNFRVPDVSGLELADWGTYLGELKNLPSVSEFSPSLIIARAERLTSEIDRAVKDIEKSQNEINLMRSPNIFGATGDPTPREDSTGVAPDRKIPSSEISPEVSVQLVKNQDAVETRKLLTTNLTRVGVIGFFVYLISLLANLYRYKMRLAAFFDGRADTLNIGKPETTEFAVLIDKFSPELVEFSRRAAWPMERFAAVAERVARAFRK